MGNNNKYTDDSYILIKRKNGNFERVLIGKRSKRHGKHRKYINHRPILYFALNNDSWVPLGEIQDLEITY